MLAELRAHYPEHHNKRGREGGRRDNEDNAPPHSNHHRYSTMTQPCHKDTTLNQQCCDSEHNEGRHNARESMAMQGARPNPNTGHHNNTPLPPFNRTTTQTGGGHPHTDGRVSTTAPALQRHATPPRHATHHPTIAPPTTTTRGELTEDTPLHEQYRHALTTHTPQHTATRQQHDMTAVLAAVRWTRRGTGHSTGPSRTTAPPPPFNGVHEEDGYHPHCLVHTTNERS